MAALRACARDLGIPATQGRRWSWGYPACPEQSEHEKLFRLIERRADRPALSGGHAVEPEQSTVAIIAHHPEAVYFGMKSGQAAAARTSAPTTSSAAATATHAGRRPGGRLSA